MFSSLFEIIEENNWGFKLFSRASDDGFIPDMVLHQGKTTLGAHGENVLPPDS